VHDVIAPVASQSADWTILVVDDKLGILDIVRRVLEQANYTVIPSRDGGDAWDILERNRPSIDLVLTDIVMPGPIEVNYILFDYDTLGWG
jgi:two-component system, cell cycle sensor histidine kinase and response regulator CckA